MDFETLKRELVETGIYRDAGRLNRIKGWFGVTELQQLAEEVLALQKKKPRTTEEEQIFEYGKTLLLDQLKGGGLPTFTSIMPTVRSTIQATYSLFWGVKRLQKAKNDLNEVETVSESVVGRVDNLLRLPLPKQRADLSSLCALLAPINEEIEKLQRERECLRLVRELSDSPLDVFYGVFKDFREQTSRVDEMSSSISGGFFETIQRFLVEQVVLSRSGGESETVESYIELLKKIISFTEKLQLFTRFDLGRYDNLEVSSYSPDNRGTTNPIAGIFTKLGGVFKSIADPERALVETESSVQALDEMIVEIDRINGFVEQLNSVQARIDSLRLTMEEIPESERESFQVALDKQMLAIKQLRSDDVELRQEVENIQRILEKLETIGGLAVSLSALEEAEVHRDDEEEFFEETAGIYRDLNSILTSSDIVDRANVLGPDISRRIDAIKEEMVRKERERKELEIAGLATTVSAAVKKVTEECIEARVTLTRALSAEDIDKRDVIALLDKGGEKLVELLQRIEEIRNKVAETGVMVGEDEAADLDTDIDNVEELRRLLSELKTVEEEVKKMVQEVNESRVGIEERERRELEVPDRARAYAKLAYAVNSVNKALKLIGIGASAFEAKYRRTDRLLVERGESNNVWSIFNVLLQRENIKRLVFDSSNKAEIAVEIYGRIFKVILQKVESTAFPGTMIPNTYDIQLQQYCSKPTPPPLGATDIDLGPLFFETPVRISKRGNLLVASDSVTKMTIVRDQYVDYDHQVDAMLRTIGMSMDDRGVVRSLGGEPGLDKVTARAVKKTPQLIVAGTGSGKSGIIATTAMSRSQGIFATQSGKLVDDMVRDINDFIKNADSTPAAIKLPSEDPDNLGHPLSEVSVVKFLDEHPYVAMSHEQLVLYAGVLRDREVFIDEVHSIVPKSYERGSKEKMAALRTIIEKNRVFGTTATPTAQTEDLLGKPVYDLTLHKVIEEIRTVRKVTPEDSDVAEDQLARASVKKLLTRCTELTAGTRGYSAVNPARNIRLSSHSQGFVFTDDAETARETYELLSNLQDDAGLRDELDREASRNRGKSGIRVYDEVVSAQRKIVEGNIKIDIILTLGVTNHTKKDLQKFLRNGRFDLLDKKYEEALEKYHLQERSKSGFIRNAQSQVNKFCASYATKIQNLPNKKNMGILMQSPKFRALFEAYKKAVGEKHSGDDNARLRSIREFREAVNTNNFNALHRLYFEFRSGDTGKLFRELFPSAAAETPISGTQKEKNERAERIKNERRLAFATLLQDPELRRQAENRTFYWLEQDKDYQDLYKRYMVAVRRSHRNDDPKIKAGAIEVAEKRFKSLVEAGNVAGLKELFNREVEESYLTDWRYIRETASAPALSDYYARVRRYFEASERGSITNTRRRDAIIGELMGTSQISALLLADPRDEEAETRTASLLEKGLIMYVVSTGPLGTGYSNPNLLSTVVVQRHSIEDLPPNKAPVIKRVQQCGRPIRDDDGIAFGTSITNEAIPERGRNLTFAQVYSPDATRYYIERTRAFEDFWLPTMEQTKDLSIALENLKDLIRLLPNNVETLTFIDKFDVDVKVKTREINKKIQALKEKSKDEAYSPMELNALIEEIRADISTLNTDDLIATINQIKENLVESQSDNIQRGLESVLGEIEKLKDLQTEKLTEARSSVQKELEEERAATTIQRVFRGYQVRSQLKREQTAATTIQSAVRDFIARSVAKKELSKIKAARVEEITKALEESIENIESIATSIEDAGGIVVRGREVLLSDTPVEGIEVDFNSLIKELTTAETEIAEALRGRSSILEGISAKMKGLRSLNPAIRRQLDAASERIEVLNQSLSTITMQREQLVKTLRVKRELQPIREVFLGVERDVREIDDKTASPEAMNVVNLDAWVETIKSMETRVVALEEQQEALRRIDAASVLPEIQEQVARALQRITMLRGTTLTALVTKRELLERLSDVQKQEQAAVAIQTVFRGYRAREELTKLRAAVAVIQEGLQSSQVVINSIEQRLQKTHGEIELILENQQLPASHELQRIANATREIEKDAERILQHHKMYLETTRNEAPKKFYAEIDGELERISHIQLALQEIIRERTHLDELVQQQSLEERITQSGINSVLTGADANFASALEKIQKIHRTLSGFQPPYDDFDTRELDQMVEDIAAIEYHAASILEEQQRNLAELVKNTPVNLQTSQSLIGISRRISGILESLSLITSAREGAAQAILDKNAIYQQWVKTKEDESQQREKEEKERQEAIEFFSETIDPVLNRSSSILVEKEKELVAIEDQINKFSLDNADVRFIDFDEIEEELRGCEEEVLGRKAIATVTRGYFDAALSSIDEMKYKLRDLRLRQDLLIIQAKAANDLKITLASLYSGLSDLRERFKEHRAGIVSRTKRLWDVTVGYFFDTDWARDRALARTQTKILERLIKRGDELSKTPLDKMSPELRSKIENEHGKVRTEIEKYREELESIEPGVTSTIASRR